MQLSHYNMFNKNTLEPLTISPCSKTFLIKSELIESELGHSELKRQEHVGVNVEVIDCPLTHTLTDGITTLRL